MSQSELEQRIKERHTAFLYVSIYDAKGKFFGLLADLSIGGFKVTSEKAIKTEGEYELFIRNPHMVPTNVSNHFKASALWSMEREVDLFETGFEFTEQTSDAKVLFEKLASDFAATSQAINALDEESYID